MIQVRINKIEESLNEARQFLNVKINEWPEEKMKDYIGWSDLSVHSFSEAEYWYFWL